MLLRHQLSTAALLGILGASVHAQHPASVNTGTLIIVARDQTTGMPVAGVEVTAFHHDEKQSRTEHTRDDGTAVMEDVPPGKYHVSLEGSEYPFATQTTAVTPGPPTYLTILLTRGAGVSGQVLSPSGMPRSGAQVELLKAVSIRPYRVFSVRAWGSTDDDGRFRLSTVESGEYYVRVSPEAEGYDALYFPGTFDPKGAVPLHLEAGEEVTLPLELPFTASPVVTGVVIGADRVVADTEVQLSVRRLDESQGCVLVETNIDVEPDGAFRVPLQSGRYGFRAVRTTPDRERILEAGAIELDVDGAGQHDLSIYLKPLYTLRGKFVASTNIPDPRNISVSVTPVGPDSDVRFGLASSPLLESESEDGTFEVVNLLGPHLLSVSAGDGWVAEAILLDDGTDVLDQAFTVDRHHTEMRVVLTDRAAVLSGSVAPNELTDEHPPMVVVFPEDEFLRESLHQVTFTAPDGAGRFRVDGIAPGRAYYVATFRGPWPLNLDALAASATRVYVDRPQTYEVTLPKRLLR